MKRLKNFVSTSVLLATIGFQTATAQAMSIAPVVGANSFKLNGSGMDSRSGMLAGANVMMATGIQDLAFETGLNYLETGAKTEMFFASAQLDLGYIAIPLLANWQFYEASGGTQWFLKGGAYLTQLMSAKQKTQVFGTSEEIDVKDQINSNDVLLTAGIGGRWTIFSNLLAAVDVNYAKGTINTAKNTEGKSEGWILNTSLIIPL